MTPLTDLDKQIIAMEAQQWRFRGAKQEAMRGLGLSPTGYYQHLNQLLDNPAAQAHDPLTINRLRRWRQTNRRDVSTIRKPA